MYNRVLSFGPSNAKLAIVGESPGQREIELGRPFVGSSGILLETMLRDFSIDIKDCKLLNVCERKPPGNNFQSTFYTPENLPTKELLEERERLKRELLELKPNLVLCLGNEALYTLTGKLGIKKWRGTLHQTRYGKVLGTYHPAFILRVYGNRPITQLDVKRAIEESQYRNLLTPKLTCHIEPSFSKVITFFEKARPHICTFDIETLDKKIRCVGFSTDGKEALCVPFMRVQKALTPGKISILTLESDNIHYWTPEQEIQIVQAMNKFFARRSIRFVAQNFSFDGPLLEMEFGTRIENYWLDTLHAHKTAFMEFPGDLDFLTSIYTRIGYYADYSAKSDRETWIYNCHDVLATYQCISPILQSLKEMKLKDFYFNHVHRLAQSITRTACNGISIDVKEREKMDGPLQEELDKIREGLEKRFGQSVNPASPKQVKNIIKNHLHLKLPSFGGKEGTHVRALDTLKANHPNEPFFEEVLIYRGKLKLLGTYVRAKLDDDGKMRTSFNPTGTTTGRVSSSQTIWKTGGNLQNIPKTDFRRLFHAPPGWKILKADLKQAESMEVAWLSKNPILIGRWTDDPDFDVHTWKASVLYEKQGNEITSSEREKAKACNHSGNYGIGFKKFSYLSGIPFTEAKELLEKHQNDPFLDSWWLSIREELHNGRILTTPFGRRRAFYGRLDEETYRQAYAFKPQSTVGDIVNRALYLCDTELDPEKAYIVMTVHDELVLQVRNEYVDEAVDILTRNMKWTHVVHPELPSLTIPVEISVGQNWWDTKEIKKCF